MVQIDYDEGKTQKFWKLTACVNCINKLTITIRKPIHNAFITQFKASEVFHSGGPVLQ